MLTPEQLMLPVHPVIPAAQRTEPWGWLRCRKQLMRKLLVLCQRRRLLLVEVKGPAASLVMPVAKLLRVFL